MEGKVFTKYQVFLITMVALLNFMVFLQHIMNLKEMKMADVDLWDM